MSGIGAARNRQKFFASFFQKRSLSSSLRFLSATIKTLEKTVPNQQGVTLHTKPRDEIVSVISPMPRAFTVAP
ncbi:MAG TPA: hypothetical protein VMB71_05985, partial [Acetobacteraceae bacterium]|nr:hypothetical protein [Acetobacteraceae bacterium]